MNMSASRISVWLHVLVISLTLEPMVQAWTEDYYTAAVYEHARQGDGENMTPAEVVKANLACYRKAASVAKEKGADIILFPEYGLFPPSGNRTFLKSFIESSPGPEEARFIPCFEDQAEEVTPILYSLSCMARENGLVVVANTGALVRCKGHPKCPEDGVFQFNTNVAFDKDGTFLMRYFKQRLFFELGYDLPVKEQDPTFKTEFGTFATFIGFDIIFKYTSDYAKNPAIDAILFSAMGLNNPPLFTSVPFWESWAMGNNATLLAANVHIPAYTSVGSGIFKGNLGTLAYTFNPDGISKLVVSRIPRSSHISSSNLNHTYSVTAITKNDSSEYDDDGQDIPNTCFWEVLDGAQNIYKDYRCYHINTTVYTLAKLDNAEGHVEACNNGLCCSVDYSANEMEEDFYLGVFNGTYEPHPKYSWAEENCFLARCDELEGKPCSVFPMHSETIFHRVNMTANFTTSIVWPTVAGNKMRPVAKHFWSYGMINNNDYEKVIDFGSTSGQRLLVVGMKGRNYDRDPPYVR